MNTIVKLNERRLEWFDLTRKDLQKLAVSKLPSRTCQIAWMRYGLQGNRVHTLEEIGSYFGLSRERVRQIEYRALHYLRDRKTKR